LINFDLINSLEFKLNDLPEHDWFICVKGGFYMR